LTPLVLSSRIDRLKVDHREHELRDKDTKTPRSKVRWAPGTNVSAVTLGARYGPQFDALDGISRHFATTASDPDYDIDDINAIVKSLHPDGLINLSVHEKKIHKLSTSVKRTALGYNNILVRWVYKHCALELSSVIADLVNITLSTGRPPHVGKTHRSHPYKKCRRSRVLLSCGQYLSRRFSVENSAEKLIVRK